LPPSWRCNIGYIHGGLLGAAAVGIAFVLPSLVMVLLLGWAYTAFGGLAWVQAYSMASEQPSSGSLPIAHMGSFSDGRLAPTTSLGHRHRPGRDNNRHRPEMVALVLLAGVLVWLTRAPPAGSARPSLEIWLVAGSHHPHSQMRAEGLRGITAAADTSSSASSALLEHSSRERIWRSCRFFTEASSLDHRWLTEQQIRDAIAVALITPGPVVITTAFIGFPRGWLRWRPCGCRGDVSAVFRPDRLAAPFFRRHGTRPGLRPLFKA
jgi:chromate transporter